MKKKNVVSDSNLNAGGNIKIGDETVVNNHGSIQQKHSGSGDNVGGDKIVNHHSTPVSNELEFTKKKWWKWIVAMGFIITTLAGIARLSGYSAKDFFTKEIVGKATSNLTIQVRPKGNYELPKEGTVKLHFGGEIIPRVIDRRGVASFPEVPNSYFSEDAKVKITFKDPLKEPFKAINEDSLYQLKPNSPIDLWVELQGLDKIYGIVKDFKTGNAIEGVRVSVLDLEAFTDKNGWFNLPILAEKQRKFHTVRATKEGYLPYEQQNVPAQTDKEMSILMKRE